MMFYKREEHYDRPAGVGTVRHIQMEDGAAQVTLDRIYDTNEVQQFVVELEHLNLFDFGAESAASQAHFSLDQESDSTTDR